MSEMPAPRPVVVMGRRRPRLPLKWISLSLLGLLLLGSREDGRDCCAQCGSYRTVASWGLGCGFEDRPLIVLVPDVTVFPTLALSDLWPTGHEHEWRLTHHRLLGLSGLAGTIVCGGLYRNAFANAYEEHPPLREFLLGELRAGRLSREDLLGMLHLSRSRPWLDSDADRALRSRAWAWMKQHAPGAPDYHMQDRVGPQDVAGDRGARATEVLPK